MFSFAELFSNPGLWVLKAFIAIIAIGLHEFGHAIIADRNGDRLPRSEGRVTLNPIAHLDPIGTLGILFMGFGWGKPVMVSREDWRVSAAGPAMNVMQAMVFGFVMRLATQTHIAFNPIAAQLVEFGFFINVALAIFNLIPVGPLDGAAILKRLLPLEEAYRFNRFNQQYGMILVFALLLTGVIGRIVGPVEAAAHQLVYLGIM